MKVIELAHLDKFFKIKSTTAQNASPEVNSQLSEVNSEPEIEASENIDLNPSDNTEQKSEEPSANQT
jgi:anti-sigma B factor antagonist